jgi:hypothetical protein
MYYHYCCYLQLLVCHYFVELNTLEILFYNYLLITFLIIWVASLEIYFMIINQKYCNSNDTIQ